MPSLVSFRRGLHYLGLCSLKGHAVSMDEMERLVHEKRIDTECERCGEPIEVFIDPDNDERYIYRAKVE